MQLGQIRKLYHELEAKLKAITAAVMKLQEEVCTQSDIPALSVVGLIRFACWVLCNDAAGCV